MSAEHFAVSRSYSPDAFEGDGELLLHVAATSADEALSGDPVVVPAATQLSGTARRQPSFLATQARYSRSGETGGCSNAPSNSGTVVSTTWLS
jgi:hypothetical protein